MEFVKSLGEANSESHAWQIILKLRENMSKGQLDEFKRKGYSFKPHKLKSQWHACLFKD